MPIAGSLSIEPVEVSRNGILQLWGLKADLTGKTREASFASRHKGITEQHDRDKERKRMGASATMA
jgi:hypothetical protein